MRYKILGRSGMRVSELCLGTMTFGDDWGWGAPRDDARRQFELFVEAGGNFIDTANRYTNGTSEAIVGELISSDRERFVVATKYTLFTRRDHPNASGNHRKNMMQAVEASLKRLNTDYIDLYWLHAWDFTTPVEEVMRAFDDLVHQGKVLHIGISDTPAWIVAQANTLAQLRGWTPFVALQIEYSLIQRDAERDLIPMADAFGLTVTPWSPLGGGVLTGKYNQQGSDAPMDKNTRYGGQGGNPRLNERNLHIAAQVVEIAEQVARTPAEVVLRWLMQQPSPMIPIIAGRHADQIISNLKAVEFTLSDEHMKTLNEVSAIDLSFPHAFLKSAQDTIYGGMRGQMDF